MRMPRTLSLAFLSAPPFNSTRTQSNRPFVAAAIRAVNPDFCSDHDRYCRSIIVILILWYRSRSRRTRRHDHSSPELECTCTIDIDMMSNINIAIARHVQRIRIISCTMSSINTRRTGFLYSLSAPSSISSCISSERPFSAAANSCRALQLQLPKFKGRSRSIRKRK